MSTPDTIEIECAADSIAFEAVFTDEQVEQIEKEQREWGVNRRIMLAFLSRSGEQLVANAGDNREDTFEKMRDFITEYRDHLKAGVELADCALARLLALSLHFEESSTEQVTQ